MLRFSLPLILLPLFAATAPAESIDDEREWLRRSREARVLYIGESHSSELDHQVQQRTLQGLDDPVVLAEMFQLPSAPVLEQYVAGNLNDAQLYEQSEWQKRWGHNWQAYLPIWQLCQQRQLPLQPLRPSSESSAQLGKLGVLGFNEQERQGLASEPHEFGGDLSPLRAIFEGHAHGHSSEAGFSRFVQVQVLWEEFMAARVRLALQQFPERRVLVLVGKGHLTLGAGLPARVQRGWSGERLVQRVALIRPSKQEQERADFWLSAQPTPEPVE